MFDADPVESNVDDQIEEQQQRLRTRQRHWTNANARRTEFAQHENDHASKIQNAEINRADR